MKYFFFAFPDFAAVVTTHIYIFIYIYIYLYISLSFICIRIHMGIKKKDTRQNKTRQGTKKEKIQIR